MSRSAIVNAVILPRDLGISRRALLSRMARATTKRRGESLLSAASTGVRGLLASDFVHGFRRSPVAIISAAVALVLIFAGMFAPWIAPHDPTDLASLSLLDSFKPPWPAADSAWADPLGTDSQGRDVLSAIMFGMRISLLVGFCSVAIAVVLGIVAGLAAGYLGGAIDTILMRIADVQLTFPAVLTALMIDGIVGAALPQTMRDQMQIPVIIVSIGISLWPGIARTLRGSTLVERNKEYVLAARVIGVSSRRIMLRHVLPNVIGPVLVLATLGLGQAILTEAALSFLGVGLPPTRPSLGTLIRYGNDYLYSGQWSVTIFPGITLVLMVLSINLLGDWLRDALNPRLR
jgi:peptide/nickel transport system permease protein